MFDLKDLFLFNGLTDEERETVVAGLGEAIVFKKGDTIYDDRHFRRALGVFLDGKGIAGNGDTTRAAFSAGDVFGAAALFGAEDRYVSRIVARTACTVLFIPEERLRNILKAHPVCAVNYVTFLSEKVRNLNRKIEQYTGGNAAARLFRLLCDKADENGRLENANMSALAHLSGLGRTSVYRAFAELEENGLVWRENKNILIKRSL